MITIYLLDCNKLDDDLIFNKYYNLMSPYRKDKIDCLRPRKGKNLSLGAGILLDNYLKQLGLKEKDMTYHTTEKGKPYFSLLPNIHFSLSHSGDVAVCAFSDNDVGCDIEQIDKPLEGVAKRFFTPNEYNYIFNGTTESIQADRFFRIWTLKEAYLKFTAEGLGGGLDSFSIFINDQNKPLINESTSEINCTKDVFFKEYYYPNYKIAVCSKENNFADQLITVEL